MSKKLLILGANGQVGSALQKEKSNWDVDCTFYTKRDLDITNLEECGQKIDNTYDFIINCAAYTKVDLAEDESDVCMSVNVGGVKNILATINENQTLIQLSSDYVYHPNHELPIKENHVCSPKGVYAQSKLIGDELTIHANNKNIVIRTSWVYYERGNNFVKTMISLMKTKDKLTIVDDQIGCPTYAKDIANTIFSMISNPNIEQKGGVYNFSNEGFISWFDFAKEIKKQAELNCELVAIPSSSFPTKAARPNNSRLNKKKIVETFELELRSWKESLRECLSTDIMKSMY